MRNVGSTGPRGISLVEILGAAVIMGIITAIVVPRLAASREEANRKADEEYKLLIDDAVERFYINENRWPALDLSDIGADSNYFPTGVPMNPVTGRAYTLNPTTHRAE
jgi:type II secretory pathway pseudopilin PulG